MNIIDHRTCPACNRSRGIRVSPGPPATMCDECEAKEKQAEAAAKNYGAGQTRRPTPELPAAPKKTAGAHKPMPKKQTK